MSIRQAMGDGLRSGADVFVGSLAKTRRRVVRRVRRGVSRLTGLEESQQRALSHFVRPQFESQLPAQKIVEPLIALGALAALIAGMSLGALSLTGLALAGLLIYAILTRVFGLNLEMGPLSV